MNILIVILVKSVIKDKVFLFAFSHVFFCHQLNYIKRYPFSTYAMVSNILGQSIIRKSSNLNNVLGIETCIELLVKKKSSQIWNDLYS